MKLKRANLMISLFLVSEARAKVDEPALDGKYRIEMKINNQVYVDQLELSGESKPVILRLFGGNLAGKIAVPGVFSAPLSGTGHCSLWASFCELNFVIIANEAGSSYKVFYHAEP